MMDERALEQLRQEQETFDQNKWQDKWWYWLRFLMSATAIIMLVVIGLMAIHVLRHASQFPPSIVYLAGSALLVKSIGFVLAIYKMVIPLQSASRLKPVTTARQMGRKELDQPVPPDAPGAQHATVTSLKPRQG